MAYRMEMKEREAKRKRVFNPATQLSYVAVKKLLLGSPQSPRDAVCFP